MMILIVLLICNLFWQGFNTLEEHGHASVNNSDVEDGSELVHNDTEKLVEDDEEEEVWFIELIIVIISF